VSHSDSLEPGWYLKQKPVRGSQVRGGMASAGARAYNGALGAEPPAGVQGAEPPVGVRGAKPP